MTREGIFVLPILLVEQRFPLTQTSTIVYCQQLNIAHIFQIVYQSKYLRIQFRDL